MKALEIYFVWKGKASIILGSLSPSLLGVLGVSGLDLGHVCVRVCEKQKDRDRDNVSSPPLAVQSLDWETFEQYCAWQLFLAHNIPLETIIPILQHLKYKGE